MKERKVQLIHNRNNAYGFQININHPLVNPKWEEYKKQVGLMTDEKRIEFERIFMSSKYYQKCIEQEKNKYGAAYDFINFAMN
jgi:hypothetical protein